MLGLCPVGKKYMYLLEEEAFVLIDLLYDNNGEDVFDLFYKLLINPIESLNMEK